MLEWDSVTRLVEHWHSQPTTETTTEARTLAEQFSETESLSTLCAGLSAVALYSGDEHYRMLAKSLFDLGIQQGLAITDLMPWHLPEDGIDNHVYSLEETVQLVAKSKGDGQTVGFLHGHYRLLTPANWANVLVAKENCDYLVLGLEDGWRTQQYKKARTAATDWQRWQWVLASGFDGCITRISRTAYDNKGYERLLRKIAPDMYFGNSSISLKLQQEMEKRAQACGARYVVLPEQPGLHSHEYIKD